MSRASTSTRSEGSSIDHNAAPMSHTHTNPPIPSLDTADAASVSHTNLGVREGGNDDPLPTPAQPRGMSGENNCAPVAPPALPASQPDDHPIEGKDWREMLVYTTGFGDNVFQELLRKAADGGQVFKSSVIGGMRVQGVHITPATDRPSSGRTVENNPGPTPATQARIPPATDRPSPGRNVENPSGQSVSMNLERPETVPGTQAQTTGASALGAAVSDENVEAPSCGSLGNLEDDLAIVAVGLQSATGETEEVVISMKVDSCPSVAQVIDHLKEIEEAQTYDLRQRLEPMSSKDVEIRTAKKPMPTHQVAELRGKWCKWGDKSQVLGRLNEVENMRRLAPCMTCQEADDIRRAAGRDVSPSAPIFVLYLFELKGNSDADLYGRNDVEEGSMARASHASRGAVPELNKDVLSYLNAVIDKEDLGVYQRHVFDQRAGQGAYPIIIFARLVEHACETLKITYSRGGSIHIPVKMGNGPSISIRDIVQFYRLKFPADLAPAPSTFGNHRSIYLRAKICVANLEKRELTEEDQTILRSLKEILLTPLNELAMVRAEAYGSLSAFKARVEKLEKRFHNKTKAKDD
ncbi:hypothetical protein F5887DRAFT_1077932 [Amanita rubescens]|nr:hypothetical protein F5887DRAFT_1077932 [Amanita rubescens]